MGVSGECPWREDAGSPASSSGICRRFTILARKRPWLMAGRAPPALPGQAKSAEATPGARATRLAQPLVGARAPARDEGIVASAPRGDQDTAEADAGSAPAPISLEVAEIGRPMPLLSVRARSVALTGMNQKMVESALRRASMEGSV